VGASTAWDRGREVEDELTGGIGETERERVRARETAPTGRPHRAARERDGGVSALGSAPIGGARLSGTGGGRTRWAKWAGLG
jgi:hypothetical protein